MVYRGEIRNRDFALQVRDFSGMCFGRITPTDIDGLIEYHDKGFLFIETKYQDSELPFGQRLALERVVDNLRKPAIGIIASHDCTGDIDVAATLVREFRYHEKWHTCNNKYTTREIAERFFRMLDIRYP